MTGMEYSAATEVAVLGLIRDRSDLTVEPEHSDNGGGVQEKGFGWGCFAGGVSGVRARLTSKNSLLTGRNSMTAKPWPGGENRFGRLNSLSFISTMVSLATAL